MSSSAADVVLATTETLADAQPASAAAPVAEHRVAAVAVELDGDGLLDAPMGGDGFDEPEVVVEAYADSRSRTPSPDADDMTHLMVVGTRADAGPSSSAAPRAAAVAASSQRRRASRTRKPSAAAVAAAAQAPKSEAPPAASGSRVGAVHDEPGRYAAGKTPLVAVVEGEVRGGAVQFDIFLVASCKSARSKRLHLSLVQRAKDAKDVEGTIGDPALAGQAQPAFHSPPLWVVGKSTFINRFGEPPGGVQLAEDGVSGPTGWEPPTLRLSRGTVGVRGRPAVVATPPPVPAPVVVAAPAAAVPDLVASALPKSLEVLLRPPATAVRPSVGLPSAAAADGDDAAAAITLLQPFPAAAAAADDDGSAARTSPVSAAAPAPAVEPTRHEMEEAAAAAAAKAFAEKFKTEPPPVPSPDAETEPRVGAPAEEGGAAAPAGAADDAPAVPAVDEASSVREIDAPPDDEFANAEPDAEVEEVEVDAAAAADASPAKDDANDDTGNGGGDDDDRGGGDGDGGGPSGDGGDDATAAAGGLDGYGNDSDSDEEKARLKEEAEAEANCLACMGKHRPHTCGKKGAAMRRAGRAEQKRLREEELARRAAAGELDREPSPPRRCDGPGQCQLNPYCVRGLKHGSRGGRCRIRPPPGVVFDAADLINADLDIEPAPAPANARPRRDNAGLKGKVRAAEEAAAAGSFAAAVARRRQTAERKSSSEVLLVIDEESGELVEYGGELEASAAPAAGSSSSSRTVHAVATAAADSGTPWQERRRSMAPGSGGSGGGGDGDGKEAAVETVSVVAVEEEEGNDGDDESAMAVEVVAVEDEDEEGEDDVVAIAAAAAAACGQCTRNAWCLRGFRHGGRGGLCSRVSDDVVAMAAADDDDFIGPAGERFKDEDADDEMEDEGSSGGKVRPSVSFLEHGAVVAHGADVYVPNRRWLRMKVEGLPASWEGGGVQPVLTDDSYRPVRLGGRRGAGTENGGLSGGSLNPRDDRYKHGIPNTPPLTAEEAAEREEEVMAMEAEAAAAEAEARAMAIEEAQSVGEVAGPAEEVAPGVFKPTTKGVGAVSLYERILAITGEEEASDRDTWRSRRPVKAEDPMVEREVQKCDGCGRYRVLKQEGAVPLCWPCSRRHVVLIAQEDATDQMYQSFLDGDAHPADFTLQCQLNAACVRPRNHVGLCRLDAQRAAALGVSTMAPDGVTALPLAEAQQCPRHPACCRAARHPGMCRIDAAKAAALDAAGLGPCMPEPEETTQCPKHPACVRPARHPGLCRVDPCKAMQLGGPALVPAPRPPRGIKRPLGAAQGELLATAVGTPTGLLPTANLGPFSAAAATLGGPRPSAPPNPNPVPVAQPPPVLATPSLNPPTNLPAPFKAPTTE